MKKFLAILMAAVLAMSMMSFSFAESSAYDITLWVPEEAVELTKTVLKMKKK